MDRPVLVAGVLVTALTLASLALWFGGLEAERANSLAVLVHGLLVGVGVYLVRRGRRPVPWLPARGAHRDGVPEADDTPGERGS